LFRRGRPEELLLFGGLSAGIVTCVIIPLTEEHQYAAPSAGTA
jgi:hypothetical protein